MTLNARSRHPSASITIGDCLPTLEFEVTLTSLVMYAGATWDFHRYHYDSAYVAQRGIRLPFMDGQMMGALFSRQLMSWGGMDAFVRRLSFRLRSMVFAGDRIRLTGEVVSIDHEAGRVLVTCRLGVVTSEGAEVVRDAMGTVDIGTALDELPGNKQP